MIFGHSLDVGYRLAFGRTVHFARSIDQIHLVAPMDDVAVEVKDFNNHDTVSTPTHCVVMNTVIELDASIGHLPLRGLCGGEVIGLLTVLAVSFNHVNHLRRISSEGSCPYQDRGEAFVQTHQSSSVLDGADWVENKSPNPGEDRH